MTWTFEGWAGIPGRSWRTRLRKLDLRYGSNRWRLRHKIRDEVLTPEEAWQLYEHSYFLYLAASPELLDQLCERATDIYLNSESNVRSGLDYRVQERASEHLADIAIRNVVRRSGRSFQGQSLVGLCKGEHADLQLNPAVVPFYRPELIRRPPLAGPWHPCSVESFWLSNRIIEVWRGEEHPEG